MGVGVSVGMALGVGVGEQDIDGVWRLTAVPPWVTLQGIKGVEFVVIDLIEVACDDRAIQFTVEHLVLMRDHKGNATTKVREIHCKVIDRGSDRLTNVNSTAKKPTVVTVVGAQSAIFSNKFINDLHTNQYHFIFVCI